MELNRFNNILPHGVPRMPVPDISPAWEQPRPSASATAAAAATTVVASDATNTAAADNGIYAIDQAPPATEQQGAPQQGHQSDPQKVFMQMDLPNFVVDFLLGRGVSLTMSLQESSSAASSAAGAAAGNSMLWNTPRSAPRDTITFVSSPAVMVAGTDDAAAADDAADDAAGVDDDASYAYNYYYYGYNYDDGANNDDDAAAVDDADDDGEGDDDDDDAEDDDDDDNEDDHDDSTEMKKKRKFTATTSKRPAGKKNAVATPTLLPQHKLLRSMASTNTATTTTLPTMAAKPCAKGAKEQVVRSLNGFQQHMAPWKGEVRMRSKKEDEKHHAMSDEQDWKKQWDHDHDNKEEDGGKEGDHRDHHDGSHEHEEDNGDHNHEDHDHHHEESGGWGASSGDKGDSNDPSSSSSEEGFFGHHHDHHSGGDSHEGHGPPPLPAHHIAPDNSFAGNMGFGAEGDMCMYRGMAQGAVSQPCIGAVAELYQLRAQYWEETQLATMPPHHHHFGVLIVLLLLVFCAVRRFRMARYHKQVRSLLTALHLSPQLKAAVEAETGVQVPPPVPVASSGGCCPHTPPATGAACNSNQQECVFVRACKIVLLFVSLAVVSFIVTFTSLEITMNIVRNLDQNAPTDPETGEVHYTSPLVALSLLLLILSAQILAVSLLVKGVRICCGAGAGGRRGRAGRRNGAIPAAAVTTASAATASAASVVPSAPFESGSPRSGGNGGGRRSMAASAQQYWAALPATLFGNRTRGDGYTALLGEEGMSELSQHSVHGNGGGNNGTEMVSMSAYPAQHRPAQQQQYAAVMVPVTARPVNSINMV